MNEPRPTPGVDDLEARRSRASRRRLSVGRRIYYRLGMPLLKGLIRLLWATCRKRYVRGSDVVERMIEGGVWAPAYWHQHTFCCLNMTVDWLRRGFRAGFIISASVDGDVPARIARDWGATVVRGSAKHTNALAMRDIQQAMRQGASIVSAADGPLGPCYVFKPGVVLMARIGNAPLVPMSCAADRYWTLRRWDRFMLPKPFARVALAVGEPLEIPRGTPPGELEPYRLEIEARTNALMNESKAALEAMN